MQPVEDTFRVHADFSLPALDGSGCGVLGPVVRSTVDAFVDTSDLRLSRHGITLRRRSGDGTTGWRLAPGQVGEAVGVGPVDNPSDGATPPDRLTDLVLAFVRGAPLGVRATVSTRRSTYRLVGADGEPVAEVRDDLVETVDAQGAPGRLRQVSVSDRGRGSPVAAEVGDLLRAAGAVTGAALPSAAEAMGAADARPTDPPAPEQVHRRDPARELVTAVLRGHVHDLLASDLAYRAGADDGLHQLRVAARRLRSGLRELADLLDDAWAAGLRDELRWLGDLLAPARDLQVVRRRLDSGLAALGEQAETSAAQDLVQSHLEPLARAAAANVTAGLRDPRYVALLDRLVAAASRPCTSGTAEQPSRKVLPVVVAASRARLARRFAAAADGDPDSLHRARIAAKRTRYLAEALAPLYGKQARAYATTLAGVQDLLGEHQDATVAVDLLARVAAGSSSPPAAFALGLLSAQEQQRAATARAEFTRVAAEIARPRHGRWAEDR